MKSSDTNPRILCLIPAYNEQAHITTVVSEAIQYLPVLVVDDGSRDQTANLAEQAGACVLRLVPNQGKGAALTAGFRQCLAEGYEAVLTLDGDGQHDPAEIPLFLAAYQQKPSGLIIGQRDYQKMPFRRRFPNTLGRLLFSMAVGQHIPDNQSGYRLISRQLIEKLLENKESGFEFEVDMITQCLKHRMGLAWVPIRTIYAGEASHIRPLPHLLHFIRITLKAWRSMHI
jgi:glycosyltransferase involved in cell wall biosynthesis